MSCLAINPLTFAKTREALIDAYYGNHNDDDTCIMGHLFPSSDREWIEKQGARDYFTQLMLDAYHVNIQGYYTMYMHQDVCRKAVDAIHYDDYVHPMQVQKISKVQIVKSLESILCNLTEATDMEHRKGLVKFDNKQFVMDTVTTVTKVLNVAKDWLIHNLPEYKDAKWG